MKLRALLPRSGPAAAPPPSAPGPAGAPPSAAEPASLRRQLAIFGLDLAVPVAIYYLLHALGVSNLVALGAGAVLPAAGVLYQLAVRRHTDGVGLVVVATVAATIIMSVATSNPRFLLARDGLTTALWGVWFIASVAARRPAAFILARPLMEGRRVFAAGSWEALWETEPRFRRIWRVASLMWGAGMLVDAAVRVVMSYTLPIHVVPGLGLPLWAATFVVIQIVTNTYYNAAGLYRILGARWIRARQARRGGHVTPQPLRAVRRLSAGRMTVRPDLRSSSHVHDHTTGSGPAARPVRSRRSRPLAVAAATAAALAVRAIASLVAGLDVRLSAGALPEHVAAVTVTVVTVLAGLAGWAVLALLERVVPLRAGRTWTVLAAAVLAVSLTGPLDAGTTTATKIALTCMHLAAAGVLIPALARSSARRPAPRASRPRRRRGARQGARRRLGISRSWRTCQGTLTHGSAKMTPRRAAVSGRDCTGRGHRRLGTARPHDPHRLFRSPGPPAGHRHRPRGRRLALRRMKLNYPETRPPGASPIRKDH